jgi:hypothetical protein
MILIYTLGCQITITIIIIYLFSLYFLVYSFPDSRLTCQIVAMVTPWNTRQNGKKKIQLEFSFDIIVSNNCSGSLFVCCLCISVCTLINVSIYCVH